MIKSRPVHFKSINVNLLGVLGYTIVAADRATVLAPRTKSGISHEGGGDYMAEASLNSEWGRFVIIRWTTDDLGIVANEVVEVDPNPTPEEIDDKLSDVHGGGKWDGSGIPPLPGEDDTSDYRMAITNAIVDGKSTNVDGTVTVNHSLPELIAADQYLRRRAAEEERKASGVRRSPFGRITKIVPPGGNGV